MLVDAPAAGVEQVDAVDVVEPGPKGARANRNAGPGEEVAQAGERESILARRRGRWRGVPSRRRLRCRRLAERVLVPSPRRRAPATATANPPKFEPDRTMPPRGMVWPPPALCDTEYAVGDPKKIPFRRSLSRAPLAGFSNGSRSESASAIEMPPRPVLADGEESPLIAVGNRQGLDLYELSGELAGQRAKQREQRGGPRGRARAGGHLGASVRWVREGPTERRRAASLRAGRRRPPPPSRTSARDPSAATASDRRCAANPTARPTACGPAASASAARRSRR